MKEISFTDINSKLLLDVQGFLLKILPNGKIKGNSFSCGDLSGGAGKSLKVDIKTGKWSDFATGDVGGDLISLYAAVRGLTQIEAAKAISGEILGLNDVPRGTFKQETKQKPEQNHEENLRKFNNAKLKYQYNDAEGNPILWIVRYDFDDKKILVPYRYENNLLIKENLPNKRPLYRLDKIKNADSVLILEGEKCVHTAMETNIKALPITWCGGTNSVYKTDWSPLSGKNIILWPDNDYAGIKAAIDIFSRLPKDCKSLKTIGELPENFPSKPATGGGPLLFPEKPKGWDIADAIKEMNKGDFNKFVKNNLSKFTPPPTAKPTVKATEKEIQSAHSIPLPSKETQSDIPILKMRPFSMVKLMNLQVLLEGENGQQIAIVNEDTVAKQISDHPGLENKIWLDTFHNRPFINVNGEIRQLQNDRDSIDILRLLQRGWQMHKIKRGQVDNALISIYNQIQKSELREFIKNLPPWDGNERVSFLFSRYYGAEQNTYSMEISRNFLTAMIARAMIPGYKFDYMIVLEGQQNLGKSKSLRVLASENWYSTSTEKMGTKDFFQALSGNWIVGIEEMESMSNANLNDIKRTISTEKDHYRPSYGRTAIDYFRQCVFVGTTNDQQYLSDTTGNRRFWPVKCMKIDLDLLQEDRLQLFAEAYHIWKSPLSTVWKLSDEAKEIRDNLHSIRMEVDPWQESFDEWLSLKREPLEINSTIGFVDHLQKLLGNMFQVTLKHQRRIGKLMRLAGYEKSSKRSGGKVSRVWRKVK